MYSTAASAAWRYSGKVTGPDSRLSRPTTIGSPLAFFSVPRAADASGVAAVEAVELVLPEADEESSSPPQPANSAPAAATAAKHAVQFLVIVMFLLIGCWVRRSPRRRRPGSWNAGGRAGRGGPRPGLRARAVRGGARRRDRPPRARA